MTFCCNHTNKTTEVTFNEKIEEREGTNRIKRTRWNVTVAPGPMPTVDECLLKYPRIHTCTGCHEMEYHYIKLTTKQ